MQSETKLTGYPSIDKPWLSCFETGLRERSYVGIYKRMFDFVYDRQKNSPDTIVMEYYSTKISFSAFIKHVDEFCKALYGYGIRKGDFVTICMPNIPDTVYLIYAINRLGAIFNMVDPRMNPNEILNRMNATESKLFVYIQNIDAKISLIEDKIRCDKLLVLSVVDSLRDGLSAESMMVRGMTIPQKMKNRSNRNSRILNSKKFLKYGSGVAGNIDTPYEEHMTVAALYTSGTSGGRPKACLFDNEAFNIMVGGIDYAHKHNKAKLRFLAVVPFFSAYGAFDGLHHSLADGWNMIMIPNPDLTKFAKYIAKYKIQAAIGVPKMWEQISLDKSLRPDMFSEVLEPVTGGAVIPQEVVNRINRVFNAPKLKIGYGDSEHGGSVSLTLCDDLYDPKSVGILFPFNDMMVIDPETEEELSYNQAGELCISGPTMMKEYLNNPQLTEEITLYRNGIKYYRTKDKCYIDESGGIHFVDRYVVDKLVFEF